MIIVLISFFPVPADAHASVIFCEIVPDGVMPGIVEDRANDRKHIYPPPVPKKKIPPVNSKQGATVKKSMDSQKIAEEMKLIKARKLQAQREAALGVLEWQRTLMVVLAVFLFLSLSGNLVLYLYMRRTKEARLKAVSAVFQLKATSKFAEHLQKRLDGHDRKISVTEIE